MSPYNIIFTVKTIIAISKVMMKVLTSVQYSNFANKLL